jgi:ABC-2 type transport system ATP-binding protein
LTGFSTKPNFLMHFPSAWFNFKCTPQTINSLTGRRAKNTPSVAFWSEAYSMVQLSSVTKRYGAAIAVDGVSVTIEKGEFFALLGPNGAGKTTTVKMILDFVRPTAGAITIDGVSSTRHLSRIRVGYCGENPRIPPHLTGRGYCRRLASLAGLEKREANARIEALIETVGMTGKENTESRTYSKGMVQRIALAGALVCDPKLLILDEPVSGLDPIGIRDVRTILENLRSKGLTLILNSHLLSEVEKVCDTAAIMKNGRILLKDKLISIAGGAETLEDVFIRVIRDSHA